MKEVFSKGEKGMKAKKSLYLFITVGFFVWSWVISLHAASPALDFYKSKVVDYIVATTPGGGYDAYARLIGRYMQKYILGSTIIVKNVPGAGHIVGANETYFAKPDGLTIGTFDKGLIISQLIGLKGVRFDMGRFSYIGKATSEPRIMVVSKKSPYKTIKEFMESKETIRMGTSGVGSSAHNETLIFIAATGAKHLKAVAGYPGNDLNMAIMRGDVAATINSYDNLYNFIREGEARVLLKFTKKNITGLDNANLPTVWDIITSEKGRRLLAIIAQLGEIGRLTTAPPNVSADRLAVLRDAYKTALTDPKLIEEGRKEGFEFEPGYGDDVLKLVKDALNQSAENVALLKEILGKRQ